MVYTSEDIKVGQKFTYENFIGEIEYISTEKDSFNEDFVILVKWESINTKKVFYDIIKISSILESFNFGHYKMTK